MNLSIVRSLNDLVNLYFTSAYQYLEFSNFFDSRDLKGYANYFKVEAKEEIKRAMLIYDYLHKSKQNLRLMIIHAPSDEYTGIEDILRQSQNIQNKLNEAINEIYAKSLNYGDFASKVFIKWFVYDVLNELNNAKKMAEDYRLYKDNLIMLNDKYSKRIISRERINYENLQM